jgi:hypothetical protein
MIASVILAINPNSLINCPPMKARALTTTKNIENRSQYGMVSITNLIPF